MKLTIGLFGVALLVLIFAFAWHLDEDDRERMRVAKQHCAPGILVPDVDGHPLCVTPRYSGALEMGGASEMVPVLTPEYSKEGAIKWVTK
jgi:hypothetical protein